MTVLSWQAHPEARAYRVLVRDLETDDFVVREELREPRATLDSDALDGERGYDWRMQARLEPDGPWENLSPDLALRRAPAPDAIPLSWRGSDAPAYRVVIRDETEGRIVLAEAVQETRHLIDASALNRRHQHRYRIQAWVDGGWVAAGPYRRLALGRPSRSGTAPRSQGPSPVLFLYTVDTEANLRSMRRPVLERGVEEQIFSRVDGDEYGIGMQMTMLEEHGFRGTFFLDILMEEQFGEGALEPVVDAIRSRGHDIQLHLHTAPHLRYSDDPELNSLTGALMSKDPEQFRTVLALAVDRFVERVGEAPVAYRSGAYHLCDAYFPVLEEFGIRVDSTLYAFKNCGVAEWMRARTQPFRVGGVLEVPVSWMVGRHPDGDSARQFAPWRSETEAAAFTGADLPATEAPRTMVYVGHSYSYLERSPICDDAEKAAWNDEFAKFCPPGAYKVMYLDSKFDFRYLTGPDPSRIETLREALGALEGRGDVSGLTMAELANDYHDAWDAPPGPAVDPVPTWSEAAQRPAVTGTRRYSLDYLRHLEVA